MKKFIKTLSVLMVVTLVISSIVQAAPAIESKAKATVVITLDTSPHIAVFQDVLPPDMSPEYLNVNKSSEADVQNAVTSESSAAQNNGENDVNLAKKNQMLNANVVMEERGLPKDEVTLANTNDLANNNVDKIQGQNVEVLAPNTDLLVADQSDTNSGFGNNVANVKKEDTNVSQSVALNLISAKEKNAVLNDDGSNGQLSNTGLVENNNNLSQPTDVANVDPDSVQKEDQNLNNLGLASINTTNTAGALNAARQNANNLSD